jgi:hypothetical protein
VIPATALWLPEVNMLAALFRAWIYRNKGASRG